VILPSWELGASWYRRTNAQSRDIKDKVWKFSHLNWEMSMVAHYAALFLRPRVQADEMVTLPRVGPTACACVHFTVALSRKLCVLSFVMTNSISFVYCLLIRQAVFSLTCFFQPSARSIVVIVVHRYGRCHCQDSLEPGVLLSLFAFTFLCRFFEVAFSVWVPGLFTYWNSL
jgi:hypothetical protein